MADYCEHLGCVGCEYVNRNGDPSAARQTGCPDYKRPGRAKKRD